MIGAGGGVSLGGQKLLSGVVAVVCDGAGGVGGGGLGGLVEASDVEERLVGEHERVGVAEWTTIWLPRRRCPELRWVTF